MTRGCGYLEQEFELELVQAHILCEASAGVEDTFILH